MTNVFGGETNNKTFNLCLIKALKDNEGERVRIKKVCVHVLEQRLQTEFSDEKFLPLGFCAKPVFFSGIL